MQKTFVAAALLLSSLALASTWDVDPAHASANFTVKHLMVTNVHGTLGPVKGTVTIDDKDITKSKIEVSIDVNGIDTQEAKRDKHLRSADFFDVEKFPTATFTSTKIVKKGKKLLITGDLTMHGVTKPVTLDTTLSGESTNPFSGATVRAASATATINREEWGLKWNMPIANNGILVGKDVKIDIEVEMIKQGSAKPQPPPAEKK